MHGSFTVSGGSSPCDAAAPERVLEGRRRAVLAIDFFSDEVGLEGIWGCKRGGWGLCTKQVFAPSNRFI